MTTVWLPLLASVLLALAAPALHRRLTPQHGVLTLTALAVIAAGCWLLALGLLGATVVAAVPRLAGLGHWSLPALAAGDRVPTFVAVTAVALLAGHLLAAVRAVVERCHELLRAHRVVRAFPATTLVVLADAAPRAYAVGGLTGGRIAVTRGMLDALDDAERGAMLAHEQAHLDGRHHLLRLVVGLAATVDPLLRRLPRLVEQGTERWADEATAAATGDRRLVARALSRAALATLVAERPAVAPRPAFDGCDVPGRIAAMLAPAPRASLRPVVVSAVLAVAVLAATAGAAQDVDGMFDAAARVGPVAQG